jgi:hypothetical protein
LARSGNPNPNSGGVGQIAYANSLRRSSWPTDSFRPSVSSVAIRALERRSDVDRVILGSYGYCLRPLDKFSILVAFGALAGSRIHSSDPSTDCRNTPSCRCTDSGSLLCASPFPGKGREDLVFTAPGGGVLRLRGPIPRRPRGCRGRSRCRPSGVAQICCGQTRGPAHQASW